MAYSILEQVKIRLKQFHIESVENSDTVVFDSKEDNPLLEQLIDQVKQEIVSRKMYPDSYTEEKIEMDMKKYEGNIVNLVVYDRSQAGESYMTSYSENGVSRSWKDREELFAGIYPFVKIL